MKISHYLIEVVLLALLLGAPVNLAGRLVQGAVLIMKRKRWQVGPFRFAMCLLGSYAAAVSLALLTWPRLPNIWPVGFFLPAVVAEVVVVPVGLLLTRFPLRGSNAA